MRTIAIVNQKGGCGKTTTAINLAAIYAKRGCRTLLVDMDPQSHCAAGLGVPEGQIDYGIGEALVANHEKDFEPETFRWEVTRNLDLAPSTMRLATLEAPGGGLHSMPDKDRRLESLTRKLAPRYDICLIDCPPTIGLLTFNALRAARETLIPVETGYFALKGAEKQWSTLQRMIAHIGRPIACHMLATMHQTDSSVADTILATLKRRFAGQLVPTVIRYSETIREATCLGQPVIDYAPKSSARDDFVALADWLEGHAAPTGDRLHSSSHGFQSHGFNPGALGGVGRGFGGSVEHRPQVTPSGASSRAAELVQRVQRNRRPITDAPAPSQTPPTPESVPAPAPTPSRPATPSPVAVAVIAEPKPEARRTPDPLRPTVVEIATGPARYPVAVKVPAIDRLLPAGANYPKLPAPHVETESSPQVQRESAGRFGVQCFGGSVIFIQPRECGQTITVAGDFNGWSSTAHPLKWCEESGDFRARVEVPPGKYRYRLIVDGCWQADRYNKERSVNRYGEPNSLLQVRDPA